MKRNGWYPCSKVSSIHRPPEIRGALSWGNRSQGVRYQKIPKSPFRNNFSFFGHGLPLNFVSSPARRSSGDLGSMLALTINASASGPRTQWIPGCRVKYMSVHMTHTLPSFSQALEALLTLWRVWLLSVLHSQARGQASLDPIESFREQGAGASGIGHTPWEGERVWRTTWVFSMIHLARNPE